MNTRNRGKQTSDDKWFALTWHPVIADAVNDLCFLLSRGYGESAALQLVGNRYRLNKRQQMAVLRVSCSDQGIISRNNTSCIATELKGKLVEIDGFNLLIILESALSGAFVFKGRDGVYRDLASVHGSYKRVIQTEEAILLVGNTLKSLEVKSVKWYLDQPVSNSGRLKARLLEISQQNEFGWEVELAFDPDKILSRSTNIVISSDGWILEQVPKWFNLCAYLIEKHIPGANVIAI